MHLPPKIPSFSIRTGAAVIQLGDLIMILELHREGLSVTAIARHTGRDPKTVRKYIERGIEPPASWPRQVGRPSKLGPYLEYLRERVTAFPDLSAVRLTREPILSARAGDRVARRPLSFYQAIGQRLASGDRP